MTEHHAIRAYRGNGGQTPQIAVSELDEGAWRSSYSGHPLGKEHPALIGQEAGHIVEPPWTFRCRESLPLLIIELRQSDPLPVALLAELSWLIKVKFVDKN
jgi:hypothetical protein